MSLFSCERGGRGVGCFARPSFFVSAVGCQNSKTKDVFEFCNLLLHTDSFFCIKIYSAKSPVFRFVSQCAMDYMFFAILASGD